MSIVEFPHERRGPREGGEIDSNGEPPDDGGMLKRIEKLETLAEKTVERLTVIERDVAVMKSNYATAADLHKELHATTWKVIGAVALLCAAVFWMARNISPPLPLTAVTTTSTAGDRVVPGNPAPAPQK